MCVILSPLDWTTALTVTSNVTSNVTSGKSYIQTATYPTADTLSRVRVKGSWTSSNYSEDTTLQSLQIADSSGKGMGVSLSSMGVLSTMKLFRYNDGSRGVTFPLPMGIITVTLGRVTRIDWDNNCKWCGGSTSSNCRQNTYDYSGNLLSTYGKSCMVDDSTGCLAKTTIPGINETSTTINVPSQLCELTVYVVWTGTDADGEFFTSATSRFSRFTDVQMNRFATDLKGVPV